MLGFKGLSFDTISSTGANAGESLSLLGLMGWPNTESSAIIHYSPPKSGSAVLDINQVYLCDSGAQYLDGEQLYVALIIPKLNQIGTTDTTRTLVSSLVF